MQLIADMIDEIMDEYDDAEKYAKKAIEFQENRPSLAGKYAAMAKQELEHGDKLHSEIVTIIQEHRTKNGPPPEPMMQVYNWEHKKMIDHVARVKALLAMVKM